MRLEKALHSFLFVAFLVSFFQGVAYWVRIYKTETIVCNAGGPLGISVPPAILYAVTGAALSFFLIAWWKTERESLSLLWLLIIAAGGSNLIERLWYGCVLDYFTLPYFPLFNVADIVLSASVVFLLWRKVYQKG